MALKWKQNSTPLILRAGAYSHDMDVTKPVFPFEIRCGQTKGDDLLDDYAEISRGLLV